MENPQAFLDASTLSGNPLIGLTIIRKYQPNGKYHRGITTHLCEFSWPMRIRRSLISMALLFLSCKLLNGWKCILKIFFEAIRVRAALWPKPFVLKLFGIDWSTKKSGQTNSSAENEKDLKTNSLTPRQKENRINRLNKNFREVNRKLKNDKKKKRNILLIKQKKSHEDEVNELRDKHSLLAQSTLSYAQNS